MCKHPEYQQNLLDELVSQIVNPHRSQNGDAGREQKLSDLNVLGMINYENYSDLSLYSNCFNEVLRMMPPVFYSSSVTMSENLTAGNLKIRKGDVMTINMGRLQNLPCEWQEPEKFIPDRFDQKSKYFLTPSGKRRNTYSFSPFLGGQRICIGKSFIEVVSKLTVPSLLSKF